MNMTAFRKCKSVLDQKTPSIQQFNNYLNMVTDQNDIGILLRTLITKDIKNDHFIQIFDSLMKKGANINWTETKQNKSLIMIACAQGNSAIVHQMLKYELKIQEKDKNNKNCLFYALQNKKKTDANNIVSLILSKYPKMSNSEASNKMSILYYAVQKQKLQIVKLLLQKGANPNIAISDTLNTPLHYAIKQMNKNQKNERNKKGYEAIIRQLLKYNADYNLKNKQDKSALQIQQGKYKQYLLKQIEQINLENKKSSLAVYRINNPNQISNLINQADKYYIEWQNKKNLQKINKEEAEKKLLANKKASMNIPFQKLFVASQQLQHYLQCSIKEYQNEIQIEGQIDRKLAQQLRSQIQKQCQKLMAKIFIFGSYATKLNMKQSDINLAILCQSNQKQFLINFIDVLKKIQFIKQATVLGDYFVNVQCKDKFRNKFVNITLINSENLYLKKSSDMIKIYLQTYPQIRVLLYIIKNLIYNSSSLQICRLFSPYNLYGADGYALNNYGLFIMVAAYVQNQSHYKVSEHTYNTAKLLINFLKYFGYDHDYMLKGIYLAEIQNKFQYKEFLFNKYFNGVKLDIMNPLYSNQDVGATHKATKLIQDIFKVAYVTIHINYDCHIKQCRSRDKIARLTLGKYENNYRPCCILRRLFQCHQLVKHQPYYAIV